MSVGPRGVEQASGGGMPAAVIFDLDGVLVDSETIWDEARQRVVARHGGTWHSDATRAMMGMSSPEWAAYLHDELGVRRDPRIITADVVAIVEQEYEDKLPLFPRATATVRALASHWVLGLASSSNRPIIELFLDASELRPCFTATVSSEEVPRGKPAPDVYLEAAQRLGVAPRRCIAVEDSTNGIRAGIAAGMTVIAVPNTHFPPDSATLAGASKVISGLGELTAEMIHAVAGAQRR